MRIGFLACIGASSCVAALVLVPRVARALPSVRLVYMRGTGAEQCPGEPSVRAAVRTRLGYDPFFGWAQETLFLAITRKGDAFQAEIRLVDADNRQQGWRDLSVPGADCTGVIDAAALTISLAIDPSSLIRGPSAPRSSGPPPAPPSTPSPSPATETATPAPVEPSAPDGPPPPPERAALAGDVGAAAVGSLGAAPSATIGLTVFGGVEWRWLSLELEGRADLPATGAGTRPPTIVRSSLFLASLVPCAHFHVVFACPVASGGVLQATSVGTASPHESTAAWGAAGGRAGVRLPVSSRLSVRAYVEVLGAFGGRTTLTIDGTPAAYLGPWSGDVGVALAWRFP